MNESIRYEKKGAVARIALDDGKANAMSLPWFEALGAALDRAEAGGAGAILIAGRAGFFSGGLDLRLLPTLSKDELRGLSEAFAQVMLRVHTLGVPTVAAVTGHAIAGGAVLAMACDVRVLTDGAFKLQLNEVAIGIPMPRWMAFIASSVVPSHLATDVLLHSRALAPGEAVALGMASAAEVTPEAALARASQLAERLALLPRAPYAESKRRLRADGAARALDSLREEMDG